MQAECTMMLGGAIPAHDPLSKRAADLSAAIDRAKAVFVEKGLEHTTPDLIAGTRIILDPLVELTDLLREVSAVSESRHETDWQNTKLLQPPEGGKLPNSEH